MSFKLLLLQLGFTCITAADKLEFSSQILSVYEHLMEFFLFFFLFLAVFTSESGNILT